jgi:hypothetical protein
MANDIADLQFALLAVLMYLPDQLARGYAQDQIVELSARRAPDKKILGRIAKLIEARSLSAQHSDVYRAKKVIEDAVGL